MKINLSNYEKSNYSLHDLCIIQKEVGGGNTTKEEIDRIANHPNAKSLAISGLNQDTFEYLVKKYGQQFEAITFWKNKLVNDLSPLEKLVNLKYLNFFVNQRVTQLWNMKNNIHLEGLAIYDFSRLHSIEEVCAAPNLVSLSIGNRIWSKMEIESFKPLIHSSITHFAWYGKKVLDNDFFCLADTKITKLDMPISLFRLEQLTQFIASIPNLTGHITQPYTEASVSGPNKKTTYYFLCKGQRVLVKGQDEDKLDKYLKKYNALLAQYKEEKERESLSKDAIQNHK